MSRSYKKNPVVKDHNKGMKNLANRKLRRKKYDYLLQGGAYKKHFEQWDISDYLFLWEFQDYYDFHMRLWEKYDRHKGVPQPTEKDLWRDWYRTYKRK